ncbi:hypothetical protein LTS14_010155 [Recurvomyces mirabilis]|uniref:uncharacterized protein n=1 Tax=Recurvomyces mirabilis TaxID=574656 RepID=UPI002DE01F54|nr:hypothetical protein LTS14_010155 [Recurvomyces mirabilis]
MQDLATLDSRIDDRAVANGESGIALLGLVFGAAYALFRAFQRVVRALHSRRDQVGTIPKDSARRLDAIKAEGVLHGQKTPLIEPKSFGVYLGSIAVPPTQCQTRLLSQWDLVVLDPQQPGASNAAASTCTSEQVLARLDVEQLSTLRGSNDEPIGCRGVAGLAQVLAAHCRATPHTHSPYTGVLLANWQSIWQPHVFNEVLECLIALNLDVYLEIAPPTYLSSDACTRIDLSLIRGVICRNGTLSHDGKSCEYYQMDSMRIVQRALAKHASMGGHSFLMWETVDDGAELAYDVVKRSFNWCRFNTTISWIGTETALRDAEIAATMTISSEPLGALMWLKGSEVLSTHQVWRENDRVNIFKVAVSNTTNEHVQIRILPSSDALAYDKLESFVPGLASKLALSSPFMSEEVKRLSSSASWELTAPMISRDIQLDPFTYSRSGREYPALGRFPIGQDADPQEFLELVEGQRRLKDLGFLERITVDELGEMEAKLKSFVEKYEAQRISPATIVQMRELLDLVAASDSSKNDSLQIYTGLHAGFRKGEAVQFWGLYSFESFGCTNIYLSRSCVDRLGILLHTFLSSKQVDRANCFLAENLLADHCSTFSEKWQLPKQITHDVEQLTSTEATILLRRLALSEDSDCPQLAKRVQSCCEYQLIEVPSLTALRDLNTSAYLSGEVSIEQLVDSRLTWYREQGCHQPERDAAIALFKEIQARIPGMLLTQDSELLSHVEACLDTVLQKGEIDAAADFFALSVFCAFRRLAVDEIFQEVRDRNPLPNRFADQAACFAEMFATGSQCEAYLDMKSIALGRILAQKYHNYYLKHQPPQRDDKTTELPTAYASKLVDEDPSSGRVSPPLLYTISFLGIFAVPALIDILLLTTIGRGLYISTYMSDLEKTSATIGLFIGLLTCGAIGTWIGSGGSYYFFAMAFPAMNMFVLTRLTAGIAICLGLGIVVLVVVGIAGSFYAGWIFFFYFALLSTYLTLLATLSIYQVPGFAFLSGRTTVVACIPILFISPLLTLWIGHDIIVYPCVLTAFLVSLVFGARRVLSNWSNWYLRVPIVSDTDVVNWYTMSMKESGTPLPEGLNDLSATPLPRTALTAAIHKERQRWLWSKPTTDELVLKLARGYDGTMFIMDWYCKYSRTKMPFPFSPTWNCQCKAAVDTLKDMQKGLKLHNAFVHWRFGGNEVWCGVLYFIIALMDKWVALLTGGSIVGLSAANSSMFRLAVGFGLTYYLLAAVCLDSVAQPLWAIANKKTDQPIDSLRFLEDAARHDARARRKLYWGNLAKFFFTHVWGICITCVLMWTFEGSKDATIMYLAYLGAYTGLLWYQYNRIYTGSLAMVDLLIAASLGLLLGPLLRTYHPYFQWSSVIALTVSTWTAAALSIRTADIGWPRPSTKFKHASTEVKPAIYSCASISSCPSHTVLSGTFEACCSVPFEEQYRIEPTTYPGTGVMNILTSKDISTKFEPLCAQSVASENLLAHVATLWAQGNIIVDIVSPHEVLKEGQEMRSISRTLGDKLHVFVFVSSPTQGQADVHGSCIMIVEAMCRATTRAALRWTDEQSLLAECIALDGQANLSVPYGVKRQLERSRSARKKAIENKDEDELRYLLLGIDCDTEWDGLPQDIRKSLLKRCRGQVCAIDEESTSFIQENFCGNSGLSGAEHIALCNLGATLTASIHDLAQDLVESQDNVEQFQETSLLGHLGRAKFVGKRSGARRGFLERTQKILSSTVHGLRLCIKFVVMSLVAEPEFQRELEYVLANTSPIIRWPARILLNANWGYCHTLQKIVIPWFLIYHNDELSSLCSNMKGIKVVVRNHRIAIESANGPSTCFVKPHVGSMQQLRQYNGRHKQEPTTTIDLVAVNIYSDRLALQQRAEYANGSCVRTYTYEYSSGQSTAASRLPISRTCIDGDKQGQLLQYDQRGYVTAGSYIKDGNLVRFKFWYRKDARFDDELLRAEFALDHIRMRVSWCVPPPKHADQPDKWLPYTKVTEATFAEDSKVYRCVWDYDHRSHPVIKTTLNGKHTATPAMVAFDWFKILQKPTDCSFLSNNPLLSIKSTNPNFLSRLLRTNVQWYPVSTTLARTHLWKTWKGGKNFDAVTTRWLDERALRADRVLKPYWRRRDLGRLEAAKTYLNTYADAIMATTDVDPDVSSWCSTLTFKYSDLASFGQGGDTRINTRSQSTQLSDSQDTLHVLAMDTGTWPIEGGGVSACRRDMVNDLTTIRWHVLAESANDFSVPKFQIEKNVQSLTLLPLWGLDFLTPTHGVFQDSLDSAIQQRLYSTTDADIRENFFPILTSLVKCSRAVNFTREHIDESTAALVALNAYFEVSRHWSEVWTSKLVKQKWRELWLNDDVENAIPISQWLDAEHPTLLHMDNALDMWHRYLFIFSLPVPAKIPDIFQASHHFAGASYGILCKVLRNCSFHVWDHCISWREVTVFLSSAMSFDSPFVCTALMSLSRMTSVLILHHADVVLPCADFFNPGWEVEHGTQEGTLQHRNSFKRKIDPVVNGICNPESFKPTKEVKTKKPTVVMLSHVRFVKDIKNAILAADLIVNEWGFKDYQLDIYGDMEKAPAYSVECKEILASKGLRDHVALKGLGKPSAVLETAWLFLNSSISEGLPLAMGEAALTGVPVVCTDVGASFRVVTDSRTWKKLSACVAPNDSYSLAKAQIDVLAMIDEWAEYTGETEDERKNLPKISLHPTKDEVTRITERMYSKSDQRRKLGLLGRENCLNSFSSDRYLREHEQLLWVGKLLAPSFRSRSLAANPYVLTLESKDESTAYTVQDEDIWSATDAPADKTKSQRWSSRAASPWSRAESPWMFQRATSARSFVRAPSPWARQLESVPGYNISRGPSRMDDDLEAVWETDSRPESIRGLTSRLDV